MDKVATEGLREVNLLATTEDNYLIPVDRYIDITDGETALDMIVPNGEDEVLDPLIKNYPYKRGLGDILTSNTFEKLP